MFLKNILSSFLLFSVFLVAGCNQGNRYGKETIPADMVNNPNSASGNSDRSSLPAIKYDDLEHDFGRIIEGETVSYSFTFKNTGKSDLLIADVSTSCGCTVPSFPKTPIRPGESGAIKIAFNSNGKRGFQNKNIVIVANTQPNTTVIRIKAQVVNAGTEK